MSSATDAVLEARVKRANERADRVVQFAHSVLQQVHARPEITGDQLIVMNFLTRAMSTMRAVRLLVENGLAADATSCMRTLVELDIDLAYIVLKPEPRLQRFVEYDHVVYARIIDENPGTVAPDVAARARGARDRVIAHYKKHENRWTADSIKERAAKTGRKGSYRTAYALGCMSSHSGVGTLRYGMSREGDEVSLLTGSQRPTAEPINFAAGALLRLVGSVATYVGVDCESEASEVAKVFDDASTER